MDIKLTIQKLLEPRPDDIPADALIFNAPRPLLKAHQASFPNLGLLSKRAQAFQVMAAGAARRLHLNRGRFVQDEVDFEARRGPPVSEVAASPVVDPGP